MSQGLDDILDAFSRLVEEHDETEPEPGDEKSDNFRCVACERCSNCRFCTACVECDDCTYCDACVDCHGCTQSRQCHGCVTISHSSFSAGCQNSSYLALCYDCEDCVHCFGCVGLSGEEFCVLNEKYPRKEYFSLVSRLRAELDVRSTEGWRPPWNEDEEPELEELPPPPPELPKMATFDDAWLTMDGWEDTPGPAPTRARDEVELGAPENGVASQASRAGEPLDEDVVQARGDEGPTRPYPVVESEPRRGPSLRAAPRPVRRSSSKD